MEAKTRPDMHTLTFIDGLGSESQRNCNYLTNIHLHVVSIVIDQLISW